MIHFLVIITAVFYIYIIISTISVLLLENRAQAEARCISPRHNRGTDAAQTAVAMAQVMRDLG